jgi:D-glycero-D-manno-heptose 1,7-bisphosphate phosphatase
LICVFLDRDGTLIRHRPYLADPACVHLLPTVVEGLTALVHAGCKLFLHSNQSGIGRGYFSLTDAIACNDEMLRQIGLGPELFEGICVCPEAPDQAIVYRKPSPKYALEIMEKYRVTKRDICYVGDNISDLLTAQNLGCLGLGVSTGVDDLRLLLGQSGLVAARFPVFESFADAAKHMLAQFQGANAPD